MKCREFVQSLFEFRRWELSSDLMARCRAHVESCEKCRCELTETESWLSTMKACCKREKMPADLEKKLSDLMSALAMK
ncbi:MAG: hypothetical protein ACHQ9S_24270 [Candidatus Binatia bacterium]